MSPPHRVPPSTPAALESRVSGEGLGLHSLKSLPAPSPLTCRPPRGPRLGPHGAVPTSDGATFLTGLKLQGATCNNNKLSLSNAISTVLPLTQLRWVKQTNAEKKASVVSGPAVREGREMLRTCPWLCPLPPRELACN